MAKDKKPWEGRKTVQVAFRITPEENELMKDIARKRGISRSTVILWAWRVYAGLLPAEQEAHGTK